LGLTNKMPRFARSFMGQGASIQDAVSQYVADVRAQRFPAEDQLPR
jgi:ketopantoate hydroxymethyltransferase